MTLSPLIIFVLLLSLSLGAFFLYVALSLRHRKTRGGTLDLLGMQARVDAALEPEGAIILDGELWRARLRDATCTLLPGQYVRVVGVDGYFLLVEPATNNF